MVAIFGLILKLFFHEVNSRNYCSNWSHSVFLNFSYSLRCVYNFSIILLLDYFISPKLTFLHLFLTFIITFFSCFLLLFSLLAGSNETKVEKYLSFGLENLENWTWIFPGYFTEFKWSDNECWSEAKKPDWKLHDFSIFYREEILLFSFCVGNFVWYFFYNFLIFFLIH